MYDQKAMIQVWDLAGCCKTNASQYLKLPSWLINNFSTNKFELVILSRAISRLMIMRYIESLAYRWGTLHWLREEKFRRYFRWILQSLQPWAWSEGTTFVKAETVQWKGLEKWQMVEVLAYFRDQHILVSDIKEKKLCVRAFHAIADSTTIQNYNWCELVLKRLVKGNDYKKGKRKFVSCTDMFLGKDIFLLLAT